MVSKINFFIAPSIDHKSHVSYTHPNVNVIDWSSIWSHFFYWSKRNGKHHWLPNEAIRFLKYACVDEEIDLNLSDNTKKIVLDADGKDIEYSVPTTGQYQISDYNGNAIIGTARILYNIINPRNEYSLYTHCHSISTIHRTDNANGPKILLIADSMAIPWVLCLAPICSELTYVDNRGYNNLSGIHLNEYDKCFGLMVNHQKASIRNHFMLDTITYFANRIKSK